MKGTRMCVLYAVQLPVKDEDYSKVDQTTLRPHQGGMAARELAASGKASEKCGRNGKIIC